MKIQNQMTSRNRPIFFQNFRFILKEHCLIVLGGSFLIFMAIATLITLILPKHIINNPQGVLSYLAFTYHYYNFEPTYLERFPSAEMPFGLKSIISVQELDTQKAGFKGCSEYGVLPKGQIIRPQQYIVSTVKCDLASHLGFAGRIEMYFVNDRLSELVFFPNSDFGSYKIKFEAEYNVRLDGKERLWISKDLIFSENEIKGEKCVRWLDLRIRKQDSSWISKYA